MAWALMLAIAVSVGTYVTYRHAQSRMDAAQILNDSIRLQTVNLQGQTEHQVLRIEESSSDGAILQQGVVVCGGMATAADTFDGCMTPDPTRSRLSGGTKRKKQDRGERARTKRQPRCLLHRSASIGIKTSLPRRLPRLTIERPSFAPSTEVMN